MTIYIIISLIIFIRWVPNSKHDPELSDAMYRRIRDNRKESEKSLNEIFPFDQVPLTMLNKELVENVYRNLETSTLPQILIGCVSSAYHIHIPFTWQYFINGVQFFHSSTEFSMQSIIYQIYILLEKSKIIKQNLSRINNDIKFIYQ